jgi:hypothetical protein
MNGLGLRHHEYLVLPLHPASAGFLEAMMIVALGLHLPIPNIPLVRIILQVPQGHPGREMVQAFGAAQRSAVLELTSSLGSATQTLNPDPTIGSATFHGNVRAIEQRAAAHPRSTSLRVVKETIEERVLRASDL